MDKAVGHSLISGVPAARSAAGTQNSPAANIAGHQTLKNHQL